jgi:myo-inositol-1(or 4)-monophosphatase
MLNSEIRDLAKDLAVKAGQYAKQNSPRIKDSFKNGDVRDIVTNIDIEISDLLKAEIKLVFPEHNFYSEEETSLIDSEVFTWVIDPIDGTSNFARRLPNYSTCVTVLKAGEIIAAAVYAPITDELFVRDENHSYCNGEIMKVAEVSNLSNAYVNFHPGRKPTDNAWAGEMKMELLKKAKKSINLASSALDLCYLADGRTDILIYGTFTTMDVAGVIEMVRQAGGEVYNYETKQPVLFTTSAQKIIATANPSLLEDFFAEITTK